MPDITAKDIRKAATAGQPKASAKDIRKAAERRPELSARDFGAQFLAGLDEITGLATGVARMQQRLLKGTTQVAEQLGLPTEGLPVGAPTFPGQAQEPLETLSGRAGRLSGQVTGIAPFLGGAAALVRAPAAVATTAPRLTRLAKGAQRFIAGAGESFLQRPGQTVAVEAALGASAGAAGFAAQQMFPGSESAEFVAEMLGGTVPAFTPLGLTIRGAIRAKDFLRRPFTTIGGARRASARAARALPEREIPRVLERLDRPTTMDPVTGKPVLTPAQQAEDPNLLSLERAVMESSEELRREADDQVARANEVIQQGLADLGTGVPAATTVALQEGRDYIAGLLDTRLRIAAQRTDERIEQLGSGATREQANRIAEQELDAAFEAARTQRDALFDVLPLDALTPTNATVGVFEDLFKALSKAQKGDMPAIAKRLLTRPKNWDKLTPEQKKRSAFFGGETELKELRGLSSKLRQVARNARSGEKRNDNMARIADEIADAITDDIALIRAGPEVAEDVITAVAFARRMKKRFSEGAVGKLRVRRPVGGRAVPASLTLEESIGAAGPKAREAFDDLRRAFDSPEAPDSRLLIAAAEDFTTSRFLQKAVERGVMNTRAARRFITQNEELLGRMPNLRKRFEETIQAGDLSSLRQRQRQRVRFDDPRISKATLFIQKGPVETFRQLSSVQTGTATREVQNLINATQRDASGEALEGLKSGFLEFLTTGARTAGRDIEGRPFLSGFTIREALDSPTTRAMANQLLNNGERRRLDILINDLVRLEKKRAAPLPPEGIIGDKPSRLLETIAGLAGAASGRVTAQRLGSGGTVQIPGIVANRFRDLASAGVQDPAKRLIKDAVQDETLFRELLQAPLEQGALSVQATRRLNAWAVTVLAEHGGAFSPEEVEQEPFKGTQQSRSRLSPP